MSSINDRPLCFSRERQIEWISCHNFLHKNWNLRLNLNEIKFVAIRFHNSFWFKEICFDLIPHFLNNLQFEIYWKLFRKSILRFLLNALFYPGYLFKQEISLLVKVPEQTCSWNWYFRVWMNFLALIFTFFIPLFSFYTPWKHQKTKGFPMFPRGIERDQCHEMD